MNAFWKKHLWDVIVVGATALAASAAAIYVAAPKGGGSHIAEIRLDSALKQTIDLSKETSERTFVIQGKMTPMTIGVKENAIAVLESGCPHLYCVRQGYVSEAGHPIVCTYNHITIEILGSAASDIVVGN